MKTHHIPEQEQHAARSHTSWPLNARTEEQIPSLVSAAILPAQFFGEPRRDARTHWQVALLRAVLTDAIACYQRQFFTKQSRAQRLAREADAWLFSDDGHWPFACVNVCAALGIEPAYIRRGLTCWRQSLAAQTPRRLSTLSAGLRLARHAA